MNNSWTEARYSSLKRGLEHAIITGEVSRSHHSRLLKLRSFDRFDIAFLKLVTWKIIIKCRLFDDRQQGILFKFHSTATSDNTAVGAAIIRKIVTRIPCLRSLTVNKAGMFVVLDAILRHIIETVPDTLNVYRLRHIIICH